MAMSRLRKAHRAAPIVDINMIPLIDVSLVLLIIFMVLTPFLVQQQVKVNLPRAVSASEVASRPIVVGIQKAGEMTLNGQMESIGSLEGDLKNLLRRQPDRPVLIQADRELPLQNVISVMDIAKRLQVGKVGIAVEQPK
jgi:biopolymer transport protein ExbD